MKVMDCAKPIDVIELRLPPLWSMTPSSRVSVVATLPKPNTYDLVVPICTPCEEFTEERTVKGKNHLLIHLESSIDHKIGRFW